MHRPGRGSIHRACACQIVRDARATPMRDVQSPIQRVHHARFHRCLSELILVLLRSQACRGMT